MVAQIRPREVVDLAFAAITRRDWPGLVALVHPTALDSLRQESLGLIILMTEERKAGKKDSGYNPNEVIIADHLAKVGSERVPQFPGDPTIADLASVSPTEFFVRWCAAVYRAEEDPVRDVVGLQRRLIGEVQENGSLVHVLYRRESRQVEMNELHIDLPGRVMVMPLMRLHDRWQLLLNDDLGWSVNFMEAFHPSPPFTDQELKRTVRLAPEPSLPPNAPTAQPGPTETARIAFAAFERRDWKGLVALLDSERLASFQREEIGYLAAWVNSKEARGQAAREGVSVFMLSYEDSLPPEAMVAGVAEIRVPAFPNAPTLGELAHLPPADFFDEWCQAVYEVDPKKGSGGARVQLRRNIIGEVLEDRALAHVLYRSGLRYRQTWAVEQMPLKRSASGWRLLLNHDIGWSIDLSMLLHDH